MRLRQSAGIERQVTHTAKDRRAMTPQCQQAHLPVQTPTVIVVDDDPAVCNSLKFSLELEGFTVRTYRSGTQLLDSGEIRDCDCFVVDQRMPGLTGIDLIAKLRQHDVFTPAILILTHPNAALTARAKLAQIDIVEKPLLGNALVDRIREACGRSQK
jgi:FixJ family two-component response regulator